MEITRRAWSERLAQNVDGITKELMARFKSETGMEAKEFPQQFCNWVGLKMTPTAKLRIRNPLK